MECAACFALDAVFSARKEERARSFSWRVVSGSESSAKRRVRSLIRLERLSFGMMCQFCGREEMREMIR